MMKVLNYYLLTALLCCILGAPTVTAKNYLRGLEWDPGDNAADANLPPRQLGMMSMKNSMMSMKNSMMSMKNSMMSMKNSMMSNKTMMSASSKKDDARTRRPRRKCTQHPNVFCRVACSNEIEEFEALLDIVSISEPSLTSQEVTFLEHQVVVVYNKLSRMLCNPDFTTLEEAELIKSTPVSGLRKLTSLRTNNVGRKLAPGRFKNHIRAKGRCRGKGCSARVRSGLFGDQGVRRLVGVLSSSSPLDHHRVLHQVASPFGCFCNPAAVDDPGLQRAPTAEEFTAALAEVVKAANLPNLIEIIETTLIIDKCAGITCASDQVCDPTSGACQTIEAVVPCVAVIDGWGYITSTKNSLWAKFRAAYPLRPFCLLIPQPQTFGDQTPPTAYELDTLSGDGVDRTIISSVTRDGEGAEISDWFTICELDKYASGSVPFVGLFYDTSGSMNTDTAAGSRAKFIADLKAAGLSYKEVFDGSEDWISPFTTSLASAGLSDQEVIDSSEEWFGNNSEDWTAWPLPNSP